MKHKPFTLDERKLIESCLKKGYSMLEIAKITKRTRMTIWREVKRASSRESYDAEEVHFKMNEDFKSVESRLSNLEMQMEIVIDQLNKTTKG